MVFLTVETHHRRMSYVTGGNKHMLSVFFYEKKRTQRKKTKTRSVTEQNEIQSCESDSIRERVSRWKSFDRCQMIHKDSSFI